MSPSLLVVFGFSVGAMLLGWAYFRRYQIARPPVGVLGLGDVAVMIGAVVLVPFLYLALPLWLVTGILVLSMLGILYFALETVLLPRWALWLAVVVLLGADVLSNLWFGATSAPFLIINNAVLVLATVGVANLWAQGGMKARDITVLAGVLIIYDLVATSLSPLMSDLFAYLSRIPLAPFVSWGTGSDHASIGIGDLLLMTAFALVMRKAFGRPADISAMIVNLIALVTLMAPFLLGNVRGIVPVMTILGPLMVLQYLYWLRRRGPERTTKEYLRVEPIGKRSLLAPSEEG